MCLLYLLGVVDCSRDFERVGLSEHSEMESRLAVKQQVRRLQQRVCQVSQSQVMTQALRVAVVLHELEHANALSLVLSPILEGACLWNAVRVSLILIAGIFCATILKGCESESALNAQLELWFYELIGAVVEHPWAAATTAALLFALPWVILLLQCCLCSRVHKLDVTLGSGNKSAGSEPCSDVRDDDGPCEPSVSSAMPASTAPGDSSTDKPHAPSSSSSSAVQVPASSTDGHVKPASLDVTSPPKPKPRAKAKHGAFHQPNEVSVYVTFRKGKCFHLKRGCSGLNGADNIDRIGLAEARTRGYTACRICAKAYL